MLNDGAVSRSGMFDQEADAMTRMKRQIGLRSANCSGSRVSSLFVATPTLVRCKEFRMSLVKLVGLLICGIPLDTAAVTKFTVI